MENHLLVVVDMQEDFINGALGTDEAKVIVQKAAEFIRNFRGRVVYTKDTHDRDYLDTQEGKNLPVQHCILQTPGWEFTPEIQAVVRGSDRVVYKPAFGSPEIGRIARDGKYDNIYFLGVCTGICVLSNAVIAKSSAPETRIHILKDLCACVTPESHETALEAMSLLQMDVMESGDYHA